MMPDRPGRERAGEGTVSASRCPADQALLLNLRAAGESVRLALRSLPEDRHPMCRTAHPCHFRQNT
jgi:hypothetical protein